MKRVSILLLSSAALLMSSFTYSRSHTDKSVVEEEGSVHIVWQSPKKYRDIRPANESRRGFQKRVFAQFDDKLEALAKVLPSGYIMKLNVSDVDLAGEVFPNGNVGGSLALGSFNRVGNGIDVRIVERAYVPRINFSYSIVNEQGEIALEGNEKLKDAGFLDTRLGRTRAEAFEHETNMLERWFDRDIAPRFSD